MVILDYIFENINSDAYNDLIMFDLPLILDSTKLDINDFFSRDTGDKAAYSLVQDLCNMETPFKDIDLPLFSDLQSEHIELARIDHPRNLL
jgi:hypothetical protein